MSQIHLPTELAEQRCSSLVNHILFPHLFFHFTRSLQRQTFALLCNASAYACPCSYLIFFHSLSVLPLLRISDFIEIDLCQHACVFSMMISIRGIQSSGVESHAPLNMTSLRQDICHCILGTSDEVQK